MYLPASRYVYSCLKRHKRVNWWCDFDAVSKHVRADRRGGVMVAEDSKCAVFVSAGLDPE